MQFSLRYIFAIATLICVSLGTAMAVLPYSSGFEAVLIGLFVVEVGLAIFAILQRFIGDPLLMQLETQDAERPIAIGSMAVHVIALVVGGILFLIGGFLAAIIVDDNLTMDTQGATQHEWRLGLTFIVASVIAAFARGTSLVAMNALWIGIPLKHVFRHYIGIGIGAWVALAVWTPAHKFGSDRAPENFGMGPDLHADYGNLVSGIVALCALVVCWLSVVLFIRADVRFRSRARQWSGGLFLVGLALGPVIALGGPVESSFLSRPNEFMLVGAVIGANVGGLVGMLLGATSPPASSML